MSRYAFREPYGFEVDQRLFDKHRAYPYAAMRPGPRKPVPRVLLGVRNLDTYESRNIWMLVDTGASVSTLSGLSADALGISRRLARLDRTVTLRGISGHPVVGILRTVSVFLGGAAQDIPVAVQPDQSAMRALQRKHGLPVLPCKHDILGRAEILENYLLCFNAQRLYALRRLHTPAS